MSKIDHSGLQAVEAERHSAPRSAVGHVVAALRVPQWSKNTLVFLPVLITHSFEVAELVASVIAFFAFCLTASATYVFNDICDRDSDRRHNQKRHRVFASERLDATTGYAMILILLFLAAALASRLPIEFAMVLGAYLVSSVAYTLVFKRMLGVDVVVIACLYVMRIVAGDEAIGARFDGLDSSAWILGFSCLLFLSLAIVKRCSELSLMREDPTSRMIGRAYRVEDYPVLLAVAAASGMASIGILMLYLGSADVTENFSRAQLLWLMVPVLAFWLLRLILLANRGEIDEDPVLFTLRDPKSQICTLAVVLVALVAW